MKTEICNSFSHGFVLTEQELQRIHNLMLEQIELVSNNIKSTCQLKLKNGSIAELDSLDEIFVLDNIGATAIKRLSLTVADVTNYSSYQAFLEFRDADFENKTESIEYKIIGQDRRWVSITTSKLEERIYRIRRVAINQLINNKVRYVLFSVIFTVATMIFGFLAIRERHQSLIEPLTSIENQWKEGKIVDPVEVILLIEKAKIQAETEILSTVPLFYLVMLPLPVILIIFVWQYCFPPYNFCWGEYLGIFDRKRNLGIFISMTIIFIISVSIISKGVTLLFSIGN